MRMFRFHRSVRPIARTLTGAAAGVAFLAATAAMAQPALDEQKAAMARLSFMDGEWVGPAKGRAPSGQAYTVTQTERVGPMLGGAIKVIEGRAYSPDGSSPFNAFAVISYDDVRDVYEMRSWADGRAGTFPLELTADGFRWRIPAGQASVIYTATIKDGVWREVGEYQAPGQPARLFFEMEVRRKGDSSWPAGGAVRP